MIGYILTCVTVYAGGLKGAFACLKYSNLTIFVFLILCQLYICVKEKANETGEL